MCFFGIRAADYVILATTIDLAASVGIIDRADTVSPPLRPLWIQSLTGCLPVAYLAPAWDDDRDLR